MWAVDLADDQPGYGSLCHVRLRGTQPRDDGAWDFVGHRCTGALVMQQRELLRHVETGHSALSSQGAARVASELLGRNVGVAEVADLDPAELLACAHSALLDDRIGSEAVAAPLEDAELSVWTRRPPPASP